MNKALHPQLPARVWRFMRRYPVLPGFIITLLVVMGLFASQISPQDPLDSKLSDTGAPPVWVSGGSWDHILGADHIGRDLLSRIIHGTRISLMVASVVLTAGMLVGVTLGIVAGYKGGIWDEIIMRLVDMTYAIPFILVALVAAVIFGDSLGHICMAAICTTDAWTDSPTEAHRVRFECKDLRCVDFTHWLPPHPARSN